MSRSASTFERLLGLSPISLAMSIALILPHVYLLSRELPVWSIPPDKWEVRLLRNYPKYLVEGKGAMGVLLGENEQSLLRLWGSPQYRDYNKPELLFYKQSYFKGSFLLKKGRIIQIRLNTSPKIKEQTVWFTALGLREEDFQMQNKEKADNQNTQKIQEMIQKILNVYGDVFYTKLPLELIVQSRGIHFLFNKKGMREIRIFKPFIPR